MNPDYNIWNKWDPLQTVMLGDCYGPNFFKDIKNNKIRSALTQIATETQEDLDYFESVLKDFGCNVLRPKLDKSDSILNYMDDSGQLTGSQGVPRAPLQPRDGQLVIGNDLFYTHEDHVSIKNCLDQYNPLHKKILGPITEDIFNNYRGEGASDWPSYRDYRYRYCNSMPLSDIPGVNQEFDRIHQFEYERNWQFVLYAPSITVVGKDIYWDQKIQDDPLVYNYSIEKFKKMFSNFRLNLLTIGGHSDSCFHTLKPGVLLSLKEIQRYKDTFPEWDVCYLPDQSWDKVEGFLKLKHKVGGKWWLPEQEDNDDFTYFVETWLKDWVGYVEETVFDVNVLVLDEHHVCVNNMNPTVVEFLQKHNMEPVHVPWRHRYFWDGGLHCITLDLNRKGKQQDCFPERKQSVIDLGY